MDYRHIQISRAFRVIIKICPGQIEFFKCEELPKNLLNFISIRVRRKRCFALVETDLIFCHGIMAMLMRKFQPFL